MSPFARQLAEFEHQLDKVALLRLIYGLRDTDAGVVVDRERLDPIVARLRDCAEPLPDMAALRIATMLHVHCEAFGEAAEALAALELIHRETEISSLPARSPFQRYVTSSQWWHLCQFTLRRDGRLCRICGHGAEFGPLHVHSRFHPERFGGERPEDLISLCHRCFRGLSPGAAEGNATNHISSPCQGGAGRAEARHD